MRFSIQGVDNPSKITFMGTELSKFSIAGTQVWPAGPQVGDVINAGWITGRIEFSSRSQGLCIVGAMSGGTITQPISPLCFQVSNTWYAAYPIGGSTTYPDGTYFTFNYVPNNGSKTYIDGSTITTWGPSNMHLFAYNGTWYITYTKGQSNAKTILNAAAIASLYPRYSDDITSMTYPSGTLYNFDVGGSFYCTYQGVSDVFALDSGTQRPCFAAITKASLANATSSISGSSTAFSNRVRVTDAFGQKAYGTDFQVTISAVTWNVSSFTKQDFGGTYTNAQYGRKISAPFSDPVPNAIRGSSENFVRFSTAATASGQTVGRGFTAMYNANGAISTATQAYVTEAVVYDISNAQWWYVIECFDLNYYSATRFTFGRGTSGINARIVPYYEY